MPRRENAALIGRWVLLLFQTIHFDRAGETGGTVERLGEILQIDGRGWALVVTRDGDHYRCPVARLYRARGERRWCAGEGDWVTVDFVAGESVIRDFHSAVKPLTVNWANRAQLDDLLGEVRRG
jgi:hypothetical protein